MRGEKLTMRVGWLCLAAVSAGILVFGVVVALFPPACTGRTGWLRRDWAFSVC
ncbi:hypothetical protein [Pseudarthrobacter sp. LMD1-1-1.1]|uniref:hypothetical protein n=1 Tax=Pseudarthrobacter sp. LMD1-1-1.1 TaxID=3135242 RepID=UPI003425A675